MEKVTVKETRDEALVRLARQAQERGVQLFRVTTTGEVFASSVSRPGELHRVTHLSCDCVGFVRHQRCMHYAKLMADLGWLPKLAEEMAMVVCSACSGSGQCWIEGSYTPDQCFYCRGTGRVDQVVDRIPANIVPFPVAGDRRPAA